MMIVSKQVRTNPNEYEQVWTSPKESGRVKMSPNESQKVIFWAIMNYISSYD